MGETRVRARVYGPRTSLELEFPVDTGATFTKIPESLAERLGLEPEETVKVELSDGSLRERGLTEARLELMGVTRTVPIAIEPEGEEPILGYTALETLRIRVNPVTKALEPTLPIEY